MSYASSSGSPLSPRRAERYLRELPAEIYSYGIAPYDEYLDLAQNRNVNRVARQRYEAEVLPELRSRYDFFADAVHRRDVGLFRDWMRVNDEMFAGDAIDEQRFLYMLNEMATREPRFGNEILRYPGFVQSLERFTNIFLDRDPDTGIDLFGFMSAILGLKPLADRFLLPRLRDNPDILYDLTQALFERNPDVAERLLVYADQNGIELSPGQARVLYSSYYVPHLRRYPKWPVPLLREILVRQMEALPR